MEFLNNLKNCKKYRLFALFYLVCGQTFAQAPADVKSVQGTVQGKVVDNQSNEPLIGVTVLVKGTRNGTATNADGAFSLGVSDQVVLELSYTGYSTREVTADLSKPMLIQLMPSSALLDEAVVIGYGSVKKSDLTGAVSSVTTKTLTRGGNVNAVGGMQGAVSGVNIVRSNNKPGGGYTVNIRGLSSITGTTSPLVVIDGVPGASLDKVNPADIDKVDILKDASATAIYGSRGANGVIIVTTKRGGNGKPQVSYSSYVGFKRYTNLPDMMSGDEYVQLARESRRATNNNAYVDDDKIFTDPSELLAVQNHDYYDWIDAISNTALQTSHTVSANGGSEDVKYALSGGYYYEEGMLSPQDYTRYNLRASLDLKANNYLSFGGSLYLTHDIRETGNSDLLQDAFRMRPTQHPQSLATGEDLFRYPSNGLFNPLVTQQNESNRTKGTNILGNVYVSVSPIKGLELRSSFSPYLVNTQVGQYRGVFTKALQGTANGGTDNMRQTSTTNWVLDNILNYKWSKGPHALDFTGVFSMQKSQDENLYGSSKDLKFNSLWYNLQGGEITGLTSGYSQFSLMSYLGRVNYSFQDKYLFTASARYDGSSKLAPGHKWALFPSAAVAWKLKGETFLQEVDWVNDLKLRLSYGKIGNDAVDPYETNGTISGSQYYTFGSDVIGNVPNNLRNDALTWEKTSEYNLGVDFSLFNNNRIMGTVELYNRLTKDLIMNKSIPTHLGYSSINDNVGSVRNKGIEMTFNTINVLSGAFKWSSVITLAYNKNAIVDLAFKEDLGAYSPQLAGMMGDYNNKWFIGQPIRTNWDLITIGVWQLGEEQEAAKYGQLPGQFRVKDFDNDGTINPDKDRQIDGKRQADWNGGFTNIFEYKNFDLAVHAYWQTGDRERNQFYVSWALESNNLNFNNLRKDYWTPENPSNSMAQPSNMGPYRDINSTNAAVSHEVQSTDFLKIAYATLGYTFKKTLLNKIGIANVRVYTTVQNPFIFTGFSGFDPEQPTLSIGGTDAMTRNLLFGLDVTF